MSVEWENDRSNSWHRLSSHDIEELRRTFNFPENRFNENDDLIFCNKEKLVQNRSKIAFSQAQFYMKCHAQLQTVFDKFSVKTLDTYFCKDVRRFSFWTNNMLRNNFSLKKHSSLGWKPEFADILLKINKLKKPNFRLTFSTRNNQNTSLNKYKISSVISMLKQSNIS